MTASGVIGARRGGGADWRAWRDRLLASPRFQRWALRFPPTRRIARRRARALFDLCAGFVYSQVLSACVELDLFEILAEGPQRLATLAVRLNFTDDAARRLLDAARSLDLVEARGRDRYGLGSLGAALRGSPGLAAMVHHHRLLYADLADPVALLRGEAHAGQLAAYWPYDGSSPATDRDVRSMDSPLPCGEGQGVRVGGPSSGPPPALQTLTPVPSPQGRGERARPHHDIRPGFTIDDSGDLAGDAAGRPSTAAYTALMAQSQGMIAGEILDAYPVARHRRMLDVGGGDGTFACAAAARAPNLNLTVFDLPPVAERARLRFAAAGLANRADACAGDFRTDPLPVGADLVSLVRVAHDHDDPVVRALFRAVRQALAPGGTLLLAEPMADTPGAEPVGHAYFGFYLLAMGRGRSRSAAGLSAMLLEAGFARVERRPTALPMVVSVLVAHA